MARFERRVPSMSMLNTRDAHGYPFQGYDSVPKPKDTLSELVKLLQANEREDALKRDMEHWHGAYNALLQEHTAFKYEDLCESCQTIRETTPPGDTITLCTNCSQDKDTTANLRLKLEKKESELCYWQDCYETLLHQHFEDDRRGHDGTHKRV